MYRSGTLPSVGTTAVAPSDRLPTWCPQDSTNLYRVDAWGGGYFGVTPHGTVAVYPDAEQSALPQALALWAQLDEADHAAPHAIPGVARDEQL